MQLKLMSVVAMSAMMMTACTSDRIEAVAGQDALNPESPSNAVSFDTYMGRTSTTRAYSAGPITNATSGDNSLRTAQFGVFAYVTKNSDYSNTTLTALVPNFMYNQQITWSTSVTPNAWVYSPVKYWPNGTDAANADNSPSNTAQQATTDLSKLSFFAFAPYIATPEQTYAQGTHGEKPSAIGSGTTNDDKVKSVTASAYNAEKGVVAMTTNDFTGNVWVKYLMGSSAAEDQVVDLLWGLNGKANYDITNSTTAQNLGTIGDAYNINLTKQTVGEKVSFLFKHALAKIGGATHDGSDETITGDPKTCGFKVVADVDKNNGDNQSEYFGSSFNSAETLVTLKELKIQNGKSASTDGDVAVTGENNTLPTGGWFNIETGKWDETAITTDADATFEIKANNDATLTNEVYRLNEKILEIGARKNGASGTGKELVAGGATWTSGTMPSGVTTTPQNVFANEDVPGLMVIPAGDDAKLYVTVDYFVRTADPNLNAGYTEVEQIITNELSLTGLDPNKYYTIIMHLGLTSVKFEAKVADWENSASGTYDEDGNFTPTDPSDVIDASIWLPSNVVAYTVSAPVAYNVGTYQYATASHNLGDVVSGTTSGNITAVTKNSTTSTTADITVSQNNTTATVSSTTTITCELGKINLTLNQAPVAFSAAADSYAISSGSAVTLTVTNLGTSSYISNGSYTVGVYTDSSCTSPADASTFSDSTGTDGKVTFSATGTYYIKVTSGESTVTTEAITVS